MKNSAIRFVSLCAFIALALSVQSFKLSVKKASHETVVVEGVTFDPSEILLVPKFAYVLQAPGPGDSMPQKRCTRIGKDCNTPEIANVTTYEWQTFFPAIKDPKQFGEIDIHEYPAYIAYLQKIGFGM